MRTRDSDTYFKRYLRSKLALQWEQVNVLDLGEWRNGFKCGSICLDAKQSGSSYESGSGIHLRWTGVVLKSLTSGAPDDGRHRSSSVVSIDASLLFSREGAGD